MAKLKKSVKIIIDNTIHAMKTFGPQHYNQSIWCSKGKGGFVSDIPYKLEDSCGTTMCVAGWIVFANRGAAENVPFNMDEIVVVASYLIGLRDRYGNLVDEPERTYNEIFYTMLLPSSGMMPIRLDHAISMLEHFKETGEVRWEN